MSEKQFNWEERVFAKEDDGLMLALSSAGILDWAQHNVIWNTGPYQNTYFAGTRDIELTDMAMEHAIIQKLMKLPKITIGHPWGGRVTIQWQKAGSKAIYTVSGDTLAEALAEAIVYAKEATK